MPLTNLEVATASSVGLARKVMDYSLTMKKLVDAAKQPGFSIESWEPLARFVDTRRFERIGNFKEVMSWPEYVRFLTGWATTSEWECSFRRVTDGDKIVLLELEERSSSGGASNVVNSVSVYEFDDDSRIVHLDIYLQMPLPDPAMLQSYASMRLGE